MFPLLWYRRVSEPPLVLVCLTECSVTFGAELDLHLYKFELCLLLSFQPLACLS